MSKSLWVKILAGVLVVIFGLFIYAAFRGGDEPAEGEFVREDFLDQTELAEGRRLLRTLENLQKIDFAESDIFSDPAFLALLDFSAVIELQPRGRNNPFAPTTAAEVYVDRATLSETAPGTATTTEP